MSERDPRGARPGHAGRAETRKNGHSAHADDESMDPSTLDLEPGFIWSCVRSYQASRGLRCVPRQWQIHEIHGPRVHGMPLRASWDWPHALAVAVNW